MPMRRISCDQYEFDSPDSEQSLELAIASPSSHCPDLAALLDACGASAIMSPAPPSNWIHWSKIADHLHRFAGIELPRRELWREVVLISDERNDLELGVAFESTL